MALPSNRPSSGDSKTARATQAAARDAAQGDAFLREVDEALLEDQLLSTFKRWAVPVGTAIAVGLAGLGGWLYWTNHQAAEAEAHAEQFTIALDRLDAGGLDDASSRLALLGQGSDGGAVAARLLQAGILAKQGKTAAATQMFAAISADDSAPKPYRDLATIRQLSLAFDTVPVSELIARLRPLAAPGNPWFGSAGELLGMAYLKQGRKDLAAPLFGAISRDATVPDSERARARQMAGQLGFDAVDDIARAPAPSAPDAGAQPSPDQPPAQQAQPQPTGPQGAGAAASQ